MQIQGRVVPLGRRRGAGGGGNPSVTVLGTLTGPVGGGEHPWVLCPPARGWSFPGAPLGVGGTLMGTWMVALALPGDSTHIWGSLRCPPPLEGPRRAVPGVRLVPCVPSALPGWDRAKPPWAEGQGGPIVTPVSPPGHRGGRGGCGIRAESCGIWGNQLKNRCEVAGTAVLDAQGHKS